VVPIPHSLLHHHNQAPQTYKHTNMQMDRHAQRQSKIASVKCGLNLNRCSRRNRCLIVSANFNFDVNFCRHFRRKPMQNITILLFLRAKAATAFSASQPSRFCPSVCPSVTRVNQAKTVQARITKSLPSAAWKTLVSGTVKLFHKFKGSHPERER